MDFKISLPFFHPYIHVPQKNTTNDINISTLEGYTFSVLKSIQNFQVITGTGVCSKYICKYTSKIDKHNYIVILVNGAGKLVTKSTFLHNTKITSSKLGEDKYREKHRKNPQGICISNMKMLHVMLKYPEVATNLDFIKVSTMPLYLQ